MSVLFRVAIGEAYAMDAYKTVFGRTYRELCRFGLAMHRLPMTPLPV